jgi:hypothetical protein
MKFIEMSGRKVPPSQELHTTHRITIFIANYIPKEILGVST